MKEYWHHDLVCWVNKVSYNYCTKNGRLDFPINCCCDMSGALRIFLTLDQDVQRIETFSGGKQDTIYYKLPDGRWRAIDEEGRYNDSPPVSVESMGKAKSGTDM